MKILSWNCRGLGNPRTVQSLCFQTKEKAPDLVFLMETKLSQAKATKVARKARYECCVAVDAMGRGGGLMLMWKQIMKVELVNYSQRHINVIVKSEEDNSSWLLTCFYGHPEINRRKETWELLQSFNPRNMGWGVIGDFNEILSHDEKVGGRIRAESQMRAFREVVEECSLFDLGWRGAKYTWCNRHESETFTKERLDRGMANKKWIEMFPDARVNTLVALCSDHRPILLEGTSGRGQGSHFHYQFKYEMNWAKEDGCKETVAEAWQREVQHQRQNSRLQNKLELCSRKLQKWSKDLRRNRLATIK
ncbi:uncharacterized protein LOC122293656 [Carya illinoinensis]|uniref:uncharacterized protein LOC122293656 n=1 Tax=Carya illinoinensis TaxID=32201 RepID=UPI001C727985|nr:uncharacterized protein LOC122293656 [Carya illinoinensis]